MTRLEQFKYFNSAHGQKSNLCIATSSRALLIRYSKHHCPARPGLVLHHIQIHSWWSRTNPLLRYWSTSIQYHTAAVLEYNSCKLPRRAALVRRLCLPSTKGPKLTFNGVFESMLRALEALFNVKEPTIRPHSFSTCLIQYCYYLAKGIRNYSFRLLKFHVEGDFLLFGSNPGFPSLSSRVNQILGTGNLEVWWMS